MVYGLQDELCDTVVKVESDVKEEVDDDHYYQNEIDKEFEEPRGEKQEYRQLQQERLMIYGLKHELCETVAEAFCL